MLSASGEYLLDMMLSVNQLKPSPLMNTERAKDRMAYASSFSEQCLGPFE